MTIECIVKSEGHKRKESANYIGDDVLRRLGVISGSPKDSIKGFREFVESVKPENVGKYEGLLRSVECVGSNRNLLGNPQALIKTAETVTTIVDNH